MPNLMACFICCLQMSSVFPNLRVRAVIQNSDSERFESAVAEDTVPPKVVYLFFVAPSFELTGTRPCQSEYGTRAVGEQTGFRVALRFVTPAC